MHPLLERAHAEGTPFVEGNTATFVWESSVVPRLLGDFNRFGVEGPDVEPQQLEPGVWTWSLTLPDDAYLEYAFAHEGEVMLDPHNPYSITNGVGGFHNQLFMPGFHPTELIQKRPGVPHGVLSRHTIEQPTLLIGGKRTVHLYHPPTDEPCPLLVVLDGKDYIERAHIAHIVDNLIHEGRIQPLAMALIDHGDQARFIEYACSEATVGLFLVSVLPLAHEHLNLIDENGQPGVHGILGASMGGLMALYTGMRLPQVFGRVFSQSGAFEIDQYPMVVMEMVEQFPTQPLKIWMDAGRFEWLLGPNQRMCARLRERGYQVQYREYPGAHNYTSWTNEVPLGLEALFPPRP